MDGKSGVPFWAINDREHSISSSKSELRSIFLIFLVWKAIHLFFEYLDTLLIILIFLQGFFVTYKKKTDTK
jgi:hypothetical protein